MSEFAYPEIVRTEQHVDTSGQTFGMVMTAVAEQFSCGMSIDLIDPDDTVLNIETTVGFLADQFGQVARRLGWIRTPCPSPAARGGGDRGAGATTREGVDVAADVARVVTSGPDACDSDGENPAPHQPPHNTSQGAVR